MEIMKPSATCPDCGEAHDLSFSHKVLDLYQRFQKASKEERSQLAFELADAFAADHDSTDAAIGDDYHSYFEDYEKARLAFEQESVKIARLAVHVLHEFVQNNNLDLDTLKTEADRSTN